MSNSVHQSGLNDQEVQARLSSFGFNELPQAQPRSFFAICLEILREPMFLLLVFCCLLYLFLGDLYEALMLSVFVLVIIGITLIQSWKTEKTLEALKDLSSPKARVIRNKEEITIASRELVPDDIMIVEEGAKVSADAIILDCDNLMVEESMLTGESIPVSKNEADYVFSGTLITQGKAHCQVKAIGSNTKLGQIGKTLKSINKEDSPFQQESSRLVSRMLVIDAVLFSVIVFIFWFFRHDLIKGLLTAVTFAIAMIPEEIPAVLTIFMALGAWRISKNHVLTKTMSSIETLGSISVLCTDKTGTLTENKMALSEIYVAGNFYKIEPPHKSIPKEFHQLCETAILASKDDSFDPIEQAILAISKLGLIGADHIHKDWKSVHEYPLSKELFAMSRAWDPPDEKQEFFVYTKGSPEAIFDLCHFKQEEIHIVTQAQEQMAKRGLRILGVAKSKTSLLSLPPTQHDIDFEFCGLLGFADPVREGVKEAVQDCYSAGIKVVMITGDYHLTAQNIAEEIGLKNSDKYIIGADLDKLSDRELEARIQDITIFSRVIPEQKLRIIRAFKAHNQVIAMTGDGVNDAPALKASDVGIAMGQRGTDVAREAADLVLLDDNFASIAHAIKLGRRVFDNLSKAMSYILAIHVPIAGLTLIPVIFNGLPVIFFPIHVAFLELIIDPTCSIIFEAEPARNNIMNRAPKKISEPMLNYQRIKLSILQGLSILTFVVSVYFFCIHLDLESNQIRLISFTALLAGNIGLTLMNKSWEYSSLKEFAQRNRPLLLIICVILACFSLILNIPKIRELFYF